jgi:hypothetical protein
MIEEKSSMILALKAKVGELMEKSLVARRSSESDFLNKIEEQVSYIQAEIAKERAWCDETWEGYAKFTEIDLPQIQDTLTKQTLQREEWEARILTEMHESIKQLNAQML